VTSIKPDIWFPLMTASVVPLIVVTVRCSTLLAGLLAALRRAAQSDRPHIFREFAQAMSSSRRIGEETSFSASYINSDANEQEIRDRR